jgi:hypothetical protein
MGYDLAHWLAVHPNGEDADEIVAGVEADEEMAVAFGWPELADGAAERSAERRKLYGDAPLIFAGGEDSWGTFEEELKGLSRRFPRALFTLTTEGEDFGDFPTRRYFRGGRVQTERCGFAPFDPDKLEGNGRGEGC